MSKYHFDKRDGKNTESANLSLSLIERGVPHSIAFTLQMFLGRGKTDRVNHNKALRSQLKAKLKRGVFECVDVREVSGAEDVLEYLEKPEVYLGSVRSVMNAGKGYDYAAKVGSRSYLVRTNTSGHKVMRIKDISGIFGGVEYNNILKGNLV